MKKSIFFAFLCLLTWQQVLSQDKKAKTQKNGTAKTDTVKKSVDTLKKGLPAYDKVVTKQAIVKKGLMNLIRVDKTYYLEIPPALMNKDILVVNRISKGAADLNNAYAGDDINENIIRFSFSPDRKSIHVSKQSFSIQGLKPGDEMYENVKRSNVEPISYSWAIKTTAPDSSKVVDISKLLNGNDPLIAFDDRVKSELKLGSMDSEGSYIVNMDAFPKNLSFKMVKTYTAGAGGGGLLGAMLPMGGNTPKDIKYTLELSSSWVLLPEKPMRMREFDERVGYFYNYFTDFGVDPQGVKARGMATRWRLEPKPEDVQRYLAGELVEPVKPIIYYIDPTTPEKWIPYLIKGVNDWQKAFEKAGFKNAIMAKRAPTKAQDSTWSLEDARYSAIVYKPSPVANASGPHVGDPRSGEILESHINWYHNVMSLLQNWYITQAGAVDPRARKATLDDSLMGELIRFVSSHEVGHTLGLRHNFIASSATPVELLRNKQWVEAHGHTSSIMDYARFNYMAQPEDNIGPAGLFPRIGDYDEWAINWGYRWMGNLSETAEKQKLSAMTTAAIKNARLRWGATAESPRIPDPRAQTEDLGDNQMKANTYGMKNLQYVAKNLPTWVVEKGQDYEKLFQLYRSGLLSQYYRYVNHALTYIGGVYNDNTGADDGAPNRYQPAPMAMQKEALDFIGKWALQPQAWLFNNEAINGKIIDPTTMAIETKLKEIIMNELMAPALLDKMDRLNQRYGTASYPLQTYIKDLQDKVWAELGGSSKISPVRQQLQVLYLENMAKLISPTAASPLDALKPLLGGMLGGMGGTTVPAVAKTLAIVNIEQLRNRISLALKNGKISDTLSRAHLKAALLNINRMLNVKGI